jgi:catechol 2,3-dioxygenase
MPARSPLWPAQVDHIRIDALDPLPVIDFYRDALGMAPAAMPDGTMLMRAPDRRILIGHGVPRSQPFTAFRVRTPSQLAQVRVHLESRGLAPSPNPSPVFGADAFAVGDPCSGCPARTCKA